MPSKNTKKRLKQNAKSVNKKVEVAPVDAETVLAEIIEHENITTETAVTAVAEIKDEKQDKKAEKSSKKKKEKKPSKIKQKSKEVFSELKKVTWPTFPQIVKKTATVLGVVAIFAVVLLGIDKLLQVVYELFIGNLK